MIFGASAIVAILNLILTAIFGAAYSVKTRTLYCVALVSQIVVGLYLLLFGRETFSSISALLFIVSAIILLVITWRKKTIPLTMIARGISIVCAVAMVVCTVADFLIIVRIIIEFQTSVPIVSLMSTLCQIAHAVLLVLIHFQNEKKADGNVVQSYATPEEQLAVLKVQFEAGEISLEVYNKCKEDILCKVK